MLQAAQRCVRRDQPMGRRDLWPLDAASCPALCYVRRAAVDSTAAASRSRALISSVLVWARRRGMQAGGAESQREAHHVITHQTLEYLFNIFNPLIKGRLVPLNLDVGSL
jgi:hypothetical protein